ncbi:MAG: PilZ domain-containing protein [Pseudomonadota bacterium]
MGTPTGENSGQIPPNADDNADRRRHRRIQLPVKARFLAADGNEHACLVANISAGGALLRAKNPPAKGEKVVLYFDRLGRVEGKVVRANDTSFAIHYAKKRVRAHRMADGLTEMINGGRRDADKRVAPRISQNSAASVKFADGRSAPCSIIDISLTGASIEIDPRPPLGEELILGRMKAKVVRRHDNGIGVVFTGSAERLDDVIKQTAGDKPDTSKVNGAAAAPAPVETGPAIARRFGKKGANA